MERIVVPNTLFDVSLTQSYAALLAKRSKQHIKTPLCGRNGDTEGQRRAKDATDTYSTCSAASIRDIRDSDCVPQAETSGQSLREGSITSSLCSAGTLYYDDTSSGNEPSDASEFGYKRCPMDLEMQLRQERRLNVTTLVLLASLVVIGAVTVGLIIGLVYGMSLASSQ